MIIASKRTRDLAWLGAALLLAWIVFSSVVENGFVFDDHFLIENNPSLNDPNYLSRVFSPGIDDSPVKDVSAIASFNAYYRPFTRALFAINYRLFGLNAAAWHGVNLTLYLLVIVAAFLLLRTITSRSEIYGSATLLFAIHPIHSEAVSWANCLVENLHALFYLTALILFILANNARKKPVKWPAIIFLMLSLIASLSAIFSKEIALTIPLFVGGYLFFVEFHNEKLMIKIRSVLLGMLPYLTIVAVYFYLRGRAGGNLGGSILANLTTSIKTLPTALIKYFSLLLIPINLSPAYPTRQVMEWLSIQFIFSSIMIIILIIIIAKYYFHEDLMRIGWLLLILPLLPILNTGMLLPEMMIQDRYLFLPSLGFALLCGIGYAMLPEKGLIARFFILILVLAIFSSLTLRQNRFWRSDLTLFEHAITVDPTSSFSYVNLGGAYLEAGNVEMGERYYTMAIKYNGDCAICFANLGEIRVTQNRLKEGLAFYREAMRAGMKNLVVMQAYAVGSMKVGDAPEAIKTFKEIAALQPKSLEALTNLARAYVAVGDNANAREWISKAMAIDNKNADLYFLSAVVYEDINDTPKAVDDYNKALSINPEHAGARAAISRLNAK